MTYEDKLNEFKSGKRQFMGLPIQGEPTTTYTKRNYVPRPVEELYPYFKDAFAKGVKAATWHQYTPYFNDGEPCEFSVYDLCVTANEEVAENWLNGDFYEDRMVEVSKEEYDEETADTFKRYGRDTYTGFHEEDGKYFRRYEEGTYDYIPGSGHPDKLEDVNIPTHQLEFEDALRTAFGDHTQVVVTPDRVAQFEYSHE